MDSEAVASALAEGTAEDREAAYATLEGAIKEQNIPFLAACARPLIQSVFCAPASKVGAEEYVRAATLFYEMVVTDTVAVCAPAHGLDAEASLCWNMFTAQDTVFAAMLAKEPSEWTLDSAILASVNFAHHVPVWAVGITAVLAAAGVSEAEWLTLGFVKCPYHDGFPARLDPPDHYTPLALKCLDLLRPDMFLEQPEAVIVGAAGLVNWMCLYPPPGSRVREACWEAGMLGILQYTMQRYNPMERISRHFQVPGAILGMCKDIIEGSQAAGLEVIQPLLAAGAVDIAISSLQAYQMMDSPSDCSVNSLQWGGLWFIEVLLESPCASQPIISKLRSAGVDAFRYVLDHPLLMMGDLGYETGSVATRIAALVWGKDDDGGGLAFKQQDIDMVVKVAGTNLLMWPMTEQSGQIILNLSISDINKELLLNAEGLIPLLVSSLLLHQDSDNPRRQQPNFHAIAPMVQRDYAEVVEQLAAYPRAREVLLRDPGIVAALEQVAAEGWEEAARNHALGGLAALCGRQPDPDKNRAPPDTTQQKHIMMSYQWNMQHVVKNIVKELQLRGFRTWFDIENLKGSTIDAMSDAVEHSEVILICISLAYKESANCRLEAQYGHLRGVPLMPLMMEEHYRPTGWLGILMGTKLYFNFHPAAIATDASFMESMDLVERNLGNCAKTLSGPPPSSSVTATPVPEGLPPSATATGSCELPPAAATPSAPARVATAPEPPPVNCPPTELATPDRSFTPSMLATMSSPLVAPVVPHTHKRSSSSVAPQGDTPFVEVLLGQQRYMYEKEERIRQEAKAEQAELRQDLQQQMDALREEMKPAHAITDQQLASLQARLEALHAAKQLTDDELYTLEDAVADYMELRSLMGCGATVTAEMAHSSGAVAKLLKLIGLSEGIAADKAFARQARRKCL